MAGKAQRRHLILRHKRSSASCGWRSGIFTLALLILFRYVLVVLVSVSLSIDRVSLSVLVELVLQLFLVCVDGI